MSPEDFPAFGPLPPVERWRGASVLARDGEGRALLQLRDDWAGVPGAGYWSLFGGMAEPGEALDVAACREFAEETGVELTPRDVRPLARLPARRQGGVHYILATARVVTPAEIRLGEGAGFAFLTREQVESFRLVPHIRRILLDHATDTAPRPV